MIKATSCPSYTKNSSLLSEIVPGRGTFTSFFVRFSALSKLILIVGPEPNRNYARVKENRHKKDDAKKEKGMRRVVVG
jgi:hypothetical protein